jgi:hypothetical protein
LLLMLPNSGVSVDRQTIPLPPIPESGQDRRMPKRPRHIPPPRPEADGSDASLPTAPPPRPPFTPTPPTRPTGMGARDILVGVVCTVCVGLGVALATSAHTALEFWAARACFIVAALGLVGAYFLWLREDVHERVVRYALGAVLIVLVIVGTPATILWINYREGAESSPAPSVQDLQNKELLALSAYLETDPLPYQMAVLRYNIMIQDQRARYFASGKQEPFPYRNYGANITLRVRQGNWNGRRIVIGETLDRSGVGIVEKPDQVAYVVQPPGIVPPQNIDFMSSPLVPSSVKGSLKFYLALEGKNGELLCDILDEYRHKDLRYFSEANSPDSPFFNSIVNDFARRVHPLTHERDAVLQSMQTYLRTK